MTESTARPLTQFYTASSLDGFLADENNSLEWLFQFGEAGTEPYLPFIAQIGAVVMGATTYEWLLEHMGPDSKTPQAWPYEMPTWVMTHRELPLWPGADVRFASGDVVPLHRTMTEVAQGKNIWVVGGGDLVGQFHDAGLLDEIIVGVAPVTLGDGAPLLPRRIVEPPLRLVEARAVGPFAYLTYAVDSRS